jgi:hypothetical protein
VARSWQTHDVPRAAKEDQSIMATRIPTANSTHPFTDLPRHRDHARTRYRLDAPVRQAYRILLFGFIVLPVVAGMDKFFASPAGAPPLAPGLLAMLPFPAHQLMMGLGVAEILAGLLVAFRPSAGALLVAVWLWASIVNLAVIGAHADLLLRDFGLSLGALALSRVARRLGH